MSTHPAVQEMKRKKKKHDTDGTPTDAPEAGSDSEEAGEDLDAAAWERENKSFASTSAVLPGDTTDPEVSKQRSVFYLNVVVCFVQHCNWGYVSLHFNLLLYLYKQ